MKIIQTKAKLTALKNVFVEWLSNDTDRYFDPDIVLPHCKTFISILENLSVSNCDLFDDLHKKPIPIPSKTTDYNGRGYIIRSDLEVM